MIPQSSSFIATKPSHKMKMKQFDMFFLTEAKPRI